MYDSHRIGVEMANGIPECTRDFVKDRAGYLLQPRLVWQEILEHNVSCAAPKYDFAIRGVLV